MLIDLIKWAVMMICFFLDYNLLHCVEKIDSYLGGRPGKASICKSVYLQPWQCRFLFACSYTAKSEPFSLWQACDYLKWMIVSGTEIRTWIFQLLLNPIFQMQFSIKILSQKGGYRSKKEFFRVVDHLRQSSCKSIEKWRLSPV